MDFKHWLIESSFDDLYDSTVRAFPGTTKRQHATDPIQITNFKFTPFLGVNTLLVRALATNEDRQYKPVILFKKVKYQHNQGQNIVKIQDQGGSKHFFERMSLENTDILVRCQCADYFWRLQHTDHEDRSLYGKDRKKYEALYNPGSANPKELPGMCKHLIKMVKVLEESGFIE